MLLGPQTDGKDEQKSKTLVDIIGLYKQMPTALDQPLTFDDFNLIRYTYIRNLFDYYGAMTDELRE